MENIFKIVPKNNFKERIHMVVERSPLYLFVHLRIKFWHYASGECTFMAAFERVARYPAMRVGRILKEFKFN